MNEIINLWRGKNVLYFTEERIRNIISVVVLGVGLFTLGISLFFINRYKKLSERLEIDVQQRTKELYEANQLLQQANMELERISMTDGLTNTYNRRYFDETIEKFWRMAIRESRPLALIMIDIDNFKIFNDTYGHLAGDECLKIVANEIKVIAKRAGDFVARYGGEEFIVTLFDTPTEGASFLAEQIREKIENTKIKYEEEEINVTVSLGVASIVPEKDMNPSDLIYAADDAMYQAKKEGSNKVIVYDSSK